LHGTETDQLTIENRTLTIDHTGSWHTRTDVRCVSDDLPCRQQEQVNVSVTGCIESVYQSFPLQPWRATIESWTSTQALGTYPLSNHTAMV